MCQKNSDRYNHRNNMLTEVITVTAMVLAFDKRHKTV